MDSNKRLKFQFDHVFGPESSQQQLFDHFSDLIVSALDGQNITIFVYSQTGAGKYREYWLLCIFAFDFFYNNDK